MIDFVALMVWWAVTIAWIPLVLRDAGSWRFWLQWYVYATVAIAATSAVVQYGVHRFL